MDLFPLWYAVYQSGGPLYGCAETLDGALEDAAIWLTPPPLAEDGSPLTPQTIHNYTAPQAPRGEIAGDLYLRRCTLALAHAVERQGGTCPYTLRDDGALDVAGA